MLPCQRALFDMPREVCYLTAASWTPLPLAGQEAGRAAVGRKGRPWLVEPGLPAREYERARTAAARLLDVDPADMAIVSSVSYGVAVAGKALAIPPGSRVLLMQDDHSSPMLEWITRAPAQGFTVETVKQPEDGDWTAALLAAIERPGAAPLSLASFSSLHWSDGCLVDLPRVAAALRKQGAAWLIDATQSAGVIAMDVRTLDPDFVVFPTYKWALGPYGRAFLYIARRRQDAIPLEQTGAGRRAITSETAPYLKDIHYVSGGRRFDMGERDHFISLEMASIGMEMVAGWGPAAIGERLRMLTDRMVEGLRNSGVRIADRRLRAPHVLSLRFPDGMPEQLVERLAAAGVHVAARLGRLRISPHVYNDEADVDRFIDAFRTLTAN